MIALILLLILLLVVALVWALLREPQAPGGGAAAATSPSPSPTASSALPPTESPDSDLTPAATEPGTSASGPVDGPQSDAGEPGTPPQFGGSGVDIRYSGTERVEFDYFGIDINWRRGYAQSSDITASRGGIVGREGTAFALINHATTAPDFETCRSQKSWTAVINWSQVKLWSMACIRTGDGRRGIMRIDEMPALDESSPSVVLTGQIWEPVVAA
ncbi:hypothetical protein [Phytohabitans kaempferiae]|uniref:Serine/threonine protein kinase n=1 Tax=Phytohabitans kaempferiae TaxID=1620943 RepID=A0ABV6M9F8_9ACTN